MTVKPDVAVWPAASAPPPLGRMVITSPDASHVGEPLHVAMIRCGERTVTVDVHPLMFPMARIVTVPLNRSAHF